MKEIDDIREALKAYRDFFDTGDEYCTCDLEVGYICEGCARRMEASSAMRDLDRLEAMLKPSEDVKDFANTLFADCIVIEDHETISWDDALAAASITAYANAKLQEAADRMPAEQDIINIMRKRCDGIASIKLSALEISRLIKAAITGSEAER